MIVAYKEISQVRKNNYGKKIVLATGTFDLFHYEHLRYLQAAKKIGDILVVAVKSNKGASFKGENRPIISEEQRIAIVDGINGVDYSVIVPYTETFQGMIPYENEQQRIWLNMFYGLCEQLRPDVLYYEQNPVLQSARELLFEKYGIKGVSRERSEIISTTKIINKIMALS